MYKKKPGQKNTTPLFSYLCLNHKQKTYFLQIKNMLNFLRYTKQFNPNKFAKFLVVFYQATASYFLGGNCRYYPSCSHYAHEAYAQHGFFSATLLVIKRLASCHPFSQKKFFDPVPLIHLNKAEKSF